MKKITWILGLVLYMAGAAEAQKIPSKNTVKQHPTIVNKTSGTTKGENASTEVQTLSHTGNWNAYSNQANTTRYFIADSTVRTLNQRANGINTSTNMEEVMGVDKKRFGIANGHLLFRTNSTTTSGTNTGSGAVGTGSSPAGLGALGPGMGVNGTSPKVGTGMTTYPATVVPSDAVRIVLPEQKAPKKGINLH